MPGLFGGLPPGLRGYVAAEEMAGQRGMRELGMASGLLGLQNQLQTQPLQRAMLEAQVAQMLQIQKLRSGAFGAGSAPQTALAQGAAQGDIGPTNTNAARIQQQGSGISPQQQAYLLSGDPGLTALANAELKRSQPIAAREGAPIVNPVTGEITFYAPKLGPGIQPTFAGGRITGAEGIPGYSQAAAQLAGAERGAQAAAEAPFQTPIETVGSRGERVFTPRPAYAAPFLNQAPAVPGISTGFPGVGRPGASVGPTAEDAAAAAARGRERAESGAKFEATVLDAGRAARNNLTQLQILAPNLENLPTGPVFPLLASGASYFKQFGIDVGGISKNLDSAQASDAILKQLALKVRDPAGGGGMPGALSDADRQFLVDSIPSLTKVPDGNRKLIQWMTALEQRKIDEASIVNSMQADGKKTNEIRDALNQFANSQRLFK